MHYGTLSLPARLFLLAWSPERNRFAGGPDLHLAVRAAALAELARRGLLHEADGTVTPVGGSRTGDAVLDGLLDLVERSRPRGWRAWVTHRSGDTLTAVRDELTAHGYLRAGRRRAPGLFPVRYWQPERADHAERLRADALAVLRGPLPVADMARGDAALVVCAATGKVRPAVTGKDRRRHKDRLDALTDRGGGASPEQRAAMRDLRKALARAVATAEAAGRWGRWLGVPHQGGQVLVEVDVAVLLAERYEGRRAVQEAAQLPGTDVDDGRALGRVELHDRAVEAVRAHPDVAVARRALRALDEQVAGERPADLDAFQGRRGGEAHPYGEGVPPVVVQGRGNGLHPRRGGDQAGLYGLLDDGGQRLLPH